MSRNTLLRWFLFFLLLFSTAFWIWAVINTATNEYVDGGVISFLTVMLTSANLLCCITQGGPGGAVPIVLQSGFCASISVWILPPASHLLVTANYAAGIILMEHRWKVIYCEAFTALWLSFMAVYLALVIGIRGEGDKGEGGEAAAEAEGEVEMQEVEIV